MWFATRLWGLNIVQSKSNSLALNSSFSDNIDDVTEAERKQDEFFYMFSVVRRAIVMERKVYFISIKPLIYLL